MGGFGAVDPASRAMAGRFALRVVCFAVFAIVPILGNHGTAQGAAAMLAVTFGFGALFSGLFAALRSEPIARGSLNDWDEALAFVAISQLAHFLARV